MTTATDNVVDYWPKGMVNRHFEVVDDDICNTKLIGQFDLIMCISVLEHIDRHDEAVANMLKLLAPGGHLLLTFPYCELQSVENVYELAGSSYGQDAPYKTRAYCRGDLERWFDPKQYCICEQEYWRFWDGDYWTVGSQVLPPEQSSADGPHQHTCIDVQKLSS